MLFSFFQLRLAGFEKVSSMPTRPPSLDILLLIRDVIEGFLLPTTIQRLV